ncbi:MAG TPA: PPOX class F420-dependent oxidoreductase [Chloroflexota bacterium]
MATVLNDSVRKALTSGNLAHLVTLNPDGSPQVTIVWVGLEDGEIVCGHLGSRQKLKNVRQDPRVALSMETGGKNEIGLDNYLVVSGRARITEGGAPELLQRLAYTYIGPNVKFPPMDNPPPGYILRIVPERVSGVGPWAAED